MFVKNSFEYDARVTKEAASLVAAGHQVTVVALHVPDVTAERETTPEGIEVIRVPRVELGLGRIARLAARAAGRAAVREAQLKGSDVDEAALRRTAAIAPPATATPGDDRVELPRPEPGPAPRGPVGRAAARVKNRLTLAAIALARAGFRAARWLFGRQGRAVKDYAIDRRMIAAGSSTGAEVFHSHDLNTLWVGHVCKRRTGARLVYDSHELATERSRMGRWWRATATWTERRLLPSVDALIVASPAWIEVLRAKHGRVPDPAVTVLNVPERRPVTPVDLHALLGIEPGRPILFYQGSIQEHRGIEAAIQSLEHLAEAVVVVVGYGYHRPALEDLAAELGLASRVRFYGPVPNRELLDHTAGADIGLCNIVSSSLSYHTSLPNKLFEYLMAGIPVIGSEAEEIARVVRQTGAGEVAPATDPAAIAAAADKILSDPEPYRAAARAAAERHHWGVEAEKLLDVYRRLS